MKQWLPIARLARLHLVIASIVLAACLTVVVGSQQFRKQLQVELGQLQNQVAAQQEELAGKERDLAYLTANLGRFRGLQAQGLGGAPEREGWVEQLVATHQELALPTPLVYTLKPPAALNAPEGPAGETAPQAAGGPQTHDLEFELHQIHEEELLALTEHYRAKVRGRFRVQSCQLAEPGRQGLAAKCMLRFFTLTDKPPTPPPAQ